MNGISLPSSLIEQNWNLTIKLTFKLKIAKQAYERIILGITLKDHKKKHKKIGSKMADDDDDDNFLISLYKFHYHYKIFF